MTAPVVSICIPTFDRLSYLKEAVASARAQVETNIEIIIGDDGDSTELRAWCLSQVADDGRVRYEKTPRRLRLAGNWNFLAGLARGEYLTLMGDDDRLLPQFVSRLSAEVRHNVAVIFSNHYVIDSKGDRLPDKSREMTRRYARAELPGGALTDSQTCVWRGVVPMSASIVRTRDVQRLGFKEDINTPEIELFVRLAAEGPTFVFVDEYLAEYRMHDGSATSAGLTIDRLAEYLQEVEVPARIEPTKRACLTPLLVAGVGVRLGRGDVNGARALRASRYYPSPTNARLLVQRATLMLPDQAVAPVYASIRQIERTWRRIRGRYVGIKSASH